MTNSLSPALFPRLRSAQGTYARSRDDAAPNRGASTGDAGQTSAFVGPGQIEERSSGEQVSDEAVMAMLRGGSQDAIGCLFRRYGRTVYTVGKRILRDAIEAED